MTTAIKILVGIAIAISFFFLGRVSTLDKGGYSTIGKVKTTVEFKTDTIYQEREVVKTVYVDKPTIVKVYKDRIIKVTQPDGTPTLAVRQYADTLDIMKDVKVHYDAEVTGTLDHVRIGLIDRRPEKIVTNTLQVTTEVERIKQVSGLYIGAFSSPNISSFGPKATIVMPKLLIGVGYDIKSDQREPLNRARLELGYKLF